MNYERALLREVLYAAVWAGETGPLADRGADAWPGNAEEIGS